MAAPAPVTVRLQNVNRTVVIAAPGAKKQLVIHKGSFRHRNNVAVVVSLHAGLNPAVFTASLTAIDSTVSFDFGDGWSLPENTTLEANLSVAGDVDLNITAHFTNDV
jgi:hypothetical protein